MKTYLKGGCIAPRILNLGSKWRRVFSSTPRSFYSRGNRPRYPLNRRLGGTQSRSGRTVEKIFIHNSDNQVTHRNLSQPDFKFRQVTLRIENYILLRAVYMYGKGKVVSLLFLTEHQAMKEYWRSGSIAPRIL
jgi:hypothetical protein